MPTGAKLIGAICFAALAYFLSDLTKPLLADTEGTRVGMLSPVNAFIGWLMGWTIMGKGAGHTYRQSLGYAFTTLAATVFWCLLIWSGYEMIKNSTRLRYDGPIEAVQDMSQIAIEYFMLIAVEPVILPAVIGTLFVSWLTEFFGRRWS